MEQGTIVKVAGPLVVAQGLASSRMFDLVRVGTEGLMGEIIEMRRDRASIQVYEETEGLGPGDPVVPTGAPLSVELGPGMLGSVYDGVQRPLDVLERQSGAFLHRGISAPGLDRSKRWTFDPMVLVGETVTGGSIIGVVQENEVIEHRILVPPNLSGEVVRIAGGEYTVEQPVGVLRAGDGTEHDLLLMQRWPVRIPRPYARKVPGDEPLVTGTRVIDTFFPLVKGGTACIPGPFGAGKTVTQHQIAKWSNAQVVVFIGCGERGNEMTDVLMEFPELVDPYSGQPLMKRTVLVANTSNMPVAAREASVYTGITMAEYFRDMGYEVVLQADSTSRWAEAMREISGRLEEMPGEEGFPAYLGTRLAAFYERAGKVMCSGGQEDEESFHTSRGVRSSRTRGRHRATGRGSDALRGRGESTRAGIRHCACRAPQGVALRARRLGLGRRLGVASRRRPFRAGRAEHASCREGLLGASRPAGLPAALPGHRLAHELLSLPRQGGAVLEGQRVRGVSQPKRRMHGDPSARERACRDRPARRH